MLYTRTILHAAWNQILVKKLMSKSVDSQSATNQSIDT